MKPATQLLSPARSERGVSLVELLIATAVSGMLAVGLFLTVMSVQRNFKACEYHVGRQTEQLRVLDYMALDMRRALTVQINNGRIDLTIPDYYDANGDPRDPVIDRGQIDYGDVTNPVPISYYKTGAVIYRNADGVEQALATDVDDMAIQFQDLGQVIEVSVTFLPTFQLSGTNNSVRNGTATYSRILLRNKRRN